MSNFLFFISEISVLNGILYFDSKKNKPFHLIENLLPLPDAFFSRLARAVQNTEEKRGQKERRNLVNKSRAFCLFVT